MAWSVRCGRVFSGYRSRIGLDCPCDVLGFGLAAASCSTMRIYVSGIIKMGRSLAPRQNDSLRTPTCLNAAIPSGTATSRPDKPRSGAAQMRCPSAPCKLTQRAPPDNDATHTHTYTHMHTHTPPHPHSIPLVCECTRACARGMPWGCVGARGYWHTPIWVP